MLDPGVLTLVGSLLLAPTPPTDPPTQLQPLPVPGAACVAPVHYLGGPLQPCSQRRGRPPWLEQAPVVPIERPGHSARDE